MPQFSGDTGRIRAVVRFNWAVLTQGGGVFDLVGLPAFEPDHAEITHSMRCPGLWGRPLVERPGEDYVLGYFADLAVYGVAFFAEQIEGLFIGDFFAAHQNAHRGTDPAAGDQRGFEVLDFVTRQDAFVFKVADHALIDGVLVFQLVDTFLQFGAPWPVAVGRSHARIIIRSTRLGA